MVFGTLIVLHPDGRHASATIDRATFTVGSAPDNSLVLTDPAVAPHHLQIISDSRRCQVLDLGSPVGTQLDGAQLPPAPRDLRNGGMLLVGGTRLIVTLAVQQEDDLLSSLLMDEGTTSDTSAGITRPNLRPAAAPQGELRGEYIPPPSQPAPPPVPQPVAPPPKPSGKAEIGLRLNADAIQVEAGQSHSVRVSVRNRSSFVDHIELAVEGIPAGWVTIRPETHDLYTQASGDSEVVFAPPRAPQSEARTYPVNIVASSTVDPDGRAAIPLNLTILPYSSYNIGLDPQRRTATMEGGFQVRIANGGNRLEQFRVNADDDEGLLGFRFAPATLRVPPGEARVSRLQTRSRKFKLVGRPVPYDFTISVEPVSGGAEPQSMRGTFAQQPPFSTWILAGLVGLMLLTCLGLAASLAFNPVRNYFVGLQMTATIQRALELATVQVSTAVAQVETTSARQTIIAETTVARETGIAETQVARSSAASSDGERQAIAQTSGAELAIARGTSQAQQAIAAGAQLTSVAQAAGLQRTIDARVVPTAITAVTQVITGEVTATPLYTVTQTFVALPIALQEQANRDATVRAQTDSFNATIQAITAEAIARDRAAFDAAQTATTQALLATQAADAARFRRTDFGSIRAADTLDPQVLSGQEFAANNLLVCFFRAERLAYPPPAPLVLPTEAPPLLPTAGPAPVETPIAPPEPALLPTVTPEPVASPAGLEGVLFRAAARQPGTQCLPEFAPSLFGASPDVRTIGITPVLLPSGGQPYPNQPFLAAETGVSPPAGAVGVLIFPSAVRQASVDLWQLGGERGYRVYGLDESGLEIARVDQPINAVFGPVNLTVVAPAGRNIRFVVVIRMDTRIAPNLREDMIGALSEPIMLGVTTAVD